jgi:hypothetical protein
MKPNVATGSFASWATSKDCDLGVDVVWLSDKNSGVQPPKKTAQLAKIVA